MAKNHNGVNQCKIADHDLILTVLLHFVLIFFQDPQQYNHPPIYTASLPKCLWVSEYDLFQTVNPAGILNLRDLCMLWSNSVTG